MKILIAQNEAPDKRNWELFKEKIIEIFISLTEYQVSYSDVDFVSNRSKITVDNIKNYDLVVANESIDGVGIGPGTIKKYFAANPKLRLILIVDKKKRGAGKLNALYEMGYYDALLSSDFRSDTLKKLVEEGRSKKAAYDYYGLMLYADFSKMKETSEEVKNIDEVPDNEVNKKGAKVDVQEKEILGGAEQSENSEKKQEQNKVKQPIKNKKSAQKGNDEVSSKTEEIGKRYESSEDGVSEKGIKPAKKKGKTSQNNSSEIRKPEAFEEKELNESSLELTYPVRKEDMREVSRTDMEEGSIVENVDDGDLLADEETSFDISEYLVPLADEKSSIQAPDFDNEPADDSLKKYIQKVSKKAYEPVRLEVSLDREDEILEELLIYYTEQEPTWLANLENGSTTKELFIAQLKQRIDLMYGELSVDERDFIYQRFANFMWGYDVLTPLIEDPSISDIALVAYDNIHVKRYGERYLSRITFRTEKHFKNFVQHIIRRNNVDLSDKKPDKTFMDTETSDVARMRFVYSQEYINANMEPSLVIRKIPNIKYTIEDLVEERRMMDYRTAAIILDAVRKGYSIWWAGPMASGKTTNINTYLDYIPHDKRGLVAQENEELFSKTHPLLTFQNIRPSEDGKTMYDLRYLSTFGLLMDINYLIIGEIKGREAEQVVEALSTNVTTWASIHSESGRDTLVRAARLAVTEHFSYDEQLRKLANGVDMIVYLENFSVKEIVRVKGWDDKANSPIYENIPINIPEKKKY